MADFESASWNRDNARGRVRRPGSPAEAYRRFARALLDPRASQAQAHSGAVEAKHTPPAATPSSYGNFMRARGVRFRRLRETRPTLFGQKTRRPPAGQSACARARSRGSARTAATGP